MTGQKQGKKLNIKRSVTVGAVIAISVILLVFACVYLFYPPKFFDALERTLEKNFSCGTAFSFSDYSDEGRTSVDILAKKFITGYEDVQISALEAHDGESRYFGVEDTDGELFEAFCDEDGMALIANNAANAYGSSVDGFESELSASLLSPSSDSQYSLNKETYRLIERAGKLLTGQSMDELKDAVELIREEYKRSDIKNERKVMLGIKEYNGTKRYVKAGDHLATPKDIESFLGQISERIEAGKEKDRDAISGIINVMNLLGADVSNAEEAIEFIDRLIDTVCETDMHISFGGGYTWLSLSYINFGIEFTDSDGVLTKIGVLADFYNDRQILINAGVCLTDSENNELYCGDISCAVRADEVDKKGDIKYSLELDVTQSGENVTRKDGYALDISAVLFLDSESKTSNFEFLYYKDSKKVVKLTLDGSYKDAKDSFSVSIDHLVVNSIEIGGVFDISAKLSLGCDDISVPEYVKISEMTEADIENDLLPTWQRISDYKKYIEKLAVRK